MVNRLSLFKRLKFGGEGRNLWNADLRPVKTWVEGECVYEREKTVFEFSPAKLVPFRDRAVIERVRRIKKEHIAKHPNPDFRIAIIKDSEIEFLWLADLFHRIKTSADEWQRSITRLVPHGR